MKQKPQIDDADVDRIVERVLADPQLAAAKPEARGEVATTWQLQSSEMRGCRRSGKRRSLIAFGSAFGAEIGFRRGAALPSGRMAKKPDRPEYLMFVAQLTDDGSLQLLMHAMLM